MDIPRFKRSRCKSTLVFLSLASALSAGAYKPEHPQVTAVAGESWLQHLHRPFDETSMGKTGRLGPPEFTPLQRNPDRQPEQPGRALATRTVTLHGEDLYRINCRGCHGELGQGAPPEINSVINPVRASSSVAVMARMKNAGMAISRREAATLARQSEEAIRERLHHGGQDMPPFDHLDEGEVRALLAYLRLLAGIPGAERRQATVREHPVHVGEHIVKSTCHVCHGATGEDPTPQQLAEGAIPPLSTLLMRTTQAEFVRKVTQGAPIRMGNPALLCRGRMPVFYYLTESEVADVYQYLAAYPPLPGLAPEAEGTLSSGKSAPRDEARPETIASVNAVGTATVPRRDLNRRSLQPESDMEVVATLSIASLFALMVIAVGVGLTVSEVKRLSAAPAANGESEVETRYALRGALGEQEPQHRVA